MHVVLIGYRAAGKTTAGRLAAERLGWVRTWTSTAVSRRAAGSPSRRSSSATASPTNSVVAELCAHDDAVVTPAEPGGPPRRLLVYLEADAEELWRRIEADPASAATRPNLAGGGLQEVVTMLARRAPVYRANADLTLDATLPPAELADRIVAAVRDRQRAGRR